MSCLKSIGCLFLAVSALSFIAVSVVSAGEVTLKTIMPASLGGGRLVMLSKTEVEATKKEPSAVFSNSKWATFSFSWTLAELKGMSSKINNEKNKIAGLLVAWRIKAPTDSSNICFRVLLKADDSGNDFPSGGEGGWYSVIGRHFYSYDFGQFFVMNYDATNDFLIRAYMIALDYSGRFTDTIPQTFHVIGYVTE